jgi:hypothetical protein
MVADKVVVNPIDFGYGLPWKMVDGGQLYLVDIVCGRTGEEGARYAMMFNL